MKKPRVEKSFQIAEHIDPTKKVRVYRNLHRDCYSVKQGGIVRCHAENVTLRSCQFIVSKAGQRRVRDEQKKNVHAFIEGYVVDTRETDQKVDGHLTDQQIENGETRWDAVYYNPYTCDTFIKQYDASPIENADYADLSILDNRVLAFSHKPPFFHQYSFQEMPVDLYVGYLPVAYANSGKL